jgi:hypothetical protein
MDIETVPAPAPASTPVAAGGDLPAEHGAPSAEHGSAAPGSAEAPEAPVRRSRRRRVGPSRQRVRTYEHVARRDYEEALRSLGSLLDEGRLEDVLLLETEDGFLVTALTRPRDDSRPSGGYDHGEFTFRDRDVIAAATQGLARRGSGYRAGRYEEALRLIGRHVNRVRGSLVLLIDEGDGFVLRTYAPDVPDMPYRFTTFRSDDLDQMREEARAARGREQPENGRRP